MGKIYHENVVKKCSIVGGGAVTTLGFTLGQNDINASTL